MSTEKFVPTPEQVEHGLYVAYAALSTMAVVPIYFGSFAALKKWKVIAWNNLPLLLHHCLPMSANARQTNAYNYADSSLILSIDH